MRASYPILIALAVTGSTLPASAVPFWHRHKPPAIESPVPQAAAPAQKSLMAQARGDNASAGGQPSANSQLHLKGPGPHKGDWLRKVLGLPPSQQEQTLEEDPSFQALPPDKQKHLLERLRTFNSLAPEKKQKILNRMEFYEHLPPEKQTEAHTLFEQYQGLPPDQRSQVSQAFHKMREMPPEQRAQYLDSDEVRSNFTDQQRDLLRGMADLYANPVH